MRYSKRDFSESYLTELLEDLEDEFSTMMNDVLNAVGLSSISKRVLTNHLRDLGSRIEDIRSTLDEYEST